MQVCHPRDPYDTFCPWKDTYEFFLERGTKKQKKHVVYTTTLNFF